MRRLRVLDSARDDLAEIYSYIEQRSGDTAVANVSSGNSTTSVSASLACPAR
jgi:plasmid stabilization system protein ParE